MKFTNLINHVAIIMDGNARWAKKKKISKKEGYVKGLDKVKEVIEICIKNKIKYLTLFALSSENINRKSVNVIFELISNKFENFLKYITQNNKVKVKVFGSLSDLPKKTKKIIQDIEIVTKNNNQLNLNIALNYGSKEEIVNAIKRLFVKKKVKIDVNNFKNYLYTKNMPDPEILIRTGGAKRLSNFLLWQLAYTEIFFIDKLWPDFTQDDFNKIILKFKKIKRNFGKI